MKRASATGILALLLSFGCLRLAVDEDQAWPCGDDGQCPDGRTCKGRSARVCLRAEECQYDEHCPSGSVCRASRCEIATPPGSAIARCLTDSDCEEGESCSSGQCRCQPSQEVCNGRDDDCDGQIDDGLWVDRACSGQGQCGTGWMECAPYSPITICSTGPGGSEDASMPEICDGVDNDCDGLVDEDFGLMPCQQGSCTILVERCKDGVPQSCPAPGPTAEVCDGVDNDCDGLVDEDPDYWVTLGNGVTNDECTRTTWQAGSSGTQLTYADAEGYCDDFQLDGLTDWSLPSLEDYLAIMDCEVDLGCTTCSMQPRCQRLFPDAPGGFYWGKRQSEQSPFITLDFDGDGARTLQGEVFAASVRAAARCVRHF